MQPIQSVVVVPLMSGFEEIEAVTIIDVLRRAELSVVVAAVEAGPHDSLLVRGSHGLALEADARLVDVPLDQIALCAIPGGQPGTDRMVADGAVGRLIQALVARGRPVAAVCAAPLVLHAAGVLHGRKATCYPSVQARLTGVEYVDSAVVVDGLVTTSRGVGTALHFALALVAQLRGVDAATSLGQAMLVPALR
jgi:4-methyl-5(b-hydroxyethyl)-thiazole monophosphate biosynthesis